MARSAHSKRQAIPTFALADSTARLLGGGINRAASAAQRGREPIGGLPPAPAGHDSSYRLDGVFFCGCDRPLTSHAALVAHHDGVRAENAARGAAGMRLAASAVTLADIADAYRKAGGGS